MFCRGLIVGRIFERGDAKSYISTWTFVRDERAHRLQKTCEWDEALQTVFFSVLELKMEPSKNRTINGP